MKVARICPLLCSLEICLGFFLESFHFPAHLARTTNTAPASGKPKGHKQRCKCKVSVLKITKNEPFVIKKQYSFFQIYWPKEKSTHIWWLVGVSHCVSKWTTVVPKIFGRSSCHLCFVLSWKERRNVKIRSIELFRVFFRIYFLSFFFLLCLQPIQSSIRTPGYPRNINLSCSFRLTFPLFRPLHAMPTSSVFSMHTHCRK